MRPSEGQMAGTSGPGNVSTKLRRIAELAGQTPKMVLTSLSHHVDADFLRDAFQKTRKDGAAGVDGQTAESFAEGLEGNLQRLLEQFKSGNYRAPPVRRVHIPKGDGSKTRPIGIPTFEDKVLQKAVCMLMEAVYEQDFLPCSWGFRPGRSPHQALGALWETIDSFNGGWVLEADIRGFFDTVVHKHLRAFLDQRVRDGVVRRSVDKWLAAGVLEGEKVTRSEIGTPQGGVISPLLANIYLHEVLDVWFEDVVKPRLEGRAELIRYADDFVMVFSSESDVRRVWDVLPKRFGKYGLSLHPEKTQVIRFERPPRRGQLPPSGADPRTFDFLGFTHYWGRDRWGGWVVKRKTMRQRLTRALKALSEWCRTNRHRSITEQARVLGQKLRGHYGYYGVTGNRKSLSRFLHWAERIWRSWLHRRSWRARMNWAHFRQLLERHPLPQPRVVHSIYRQKPRLRV